MMTRSQKATAISDLSERFGKAKAAFLVDYKGMNVEEVTELRKQLNRIQAEMKVVRNTLAKRALLDHPETLEAIDKEFVGTNAVVFAYDDVSAPAKALTLYGKDVEELQIKAGVMDGKALTEQQIEYLATLPSKEELQAKLLATFQAPMAKLVRTMNEVPAGFVRVLAAKKDAG